MQSIRNSPYFPNDVGVERKIDTEPRGQLIDNIDTDTISMLGAIASRGVRHNSLCLRRHNNQA